MSTFDPQLLRRSVQVASQLNWFALGRKDLSARGKFTAFLRYIPAESLRSQEPTPEIHSFPSTRNAVSDISRLWYKLNAKKAVTFPRECELPRSCHQNVTSFRRTFCVQPLFMRLCDCLSNGSHNVDGDQQLCAGSCAGLVCWRAGEEALRHATQTDLELVHFRKEKFQRICVWCVHVQQRYGR